MDDKNIISISENVIKLPIEAYLSLDKPQKLKFEFDEGSGVKILKKADNKWRLIRYVKSILRGEHKKPNASLIKKDDCFANYKIFNFDQANGKKYFIANYATMLYAIPIDESPEDVSRENFWSCIQGYNEHLPVNQQDDNSRRLSAYLVEIFKSFQPKSLLELGCGAGRNLVYINNEIADTDIYGIDTNPQAVKLAASSLPKAKINVQSIYNLESFESNSIDIVYTCGVLMHIPHDKVESVINEMYRIAKKAIISYELHGPSRNFDYHRYPRDYKKIYNKLGFVEELSYEIFPWEDFRSCEVKPFNHSLLILTKG